MNRFFPHARVASVPAQLCSLCGHVGRVVQIEADTRDKLSLCATCIRRLRPGAVDILPGDRCAFCESGFEPVNVGRDLVCPDCGAIADGDID